MAKETKKKKANRADADPPKPANYRSQARLRANGKERIDITVDGAAFARIEAARAKLPGFDQEAMKPYKFYGFLFNKIGKDGVDTLTVLRKLLGIE